MQIESLTLLTRDLAALHAFYGSVLELPVQLSALTLTVQVGATHLTFRQEPGFRGFYHLAFDVPPAQVDAAEAWLRRRVDLLPDPSGVQRFPPQGAWNTTNLYFDDPEGNILELIARHDLNQTGNGPFGAVGLLRVSELGVVVPDVPAAVQCLDERFGLRAFNGGSDTFTAVGGHDGMLIVVREGRGWFPVDRPAVPTPFILTASVGSRRLVLRDQALT